MPLSTQHFLLWCTLDVYIEKSPSKSVRKVQNVEVLRNQLQAEAFSNQVVELVSKQLGAEDQNYDVSSFPTYLNNVFVEVVQKTSFEQLPVAPRKSNKPWVTTEAFALIDQRVYAR